MSICRLPRFEILIICHVFLSSRCNSLLPRPMSFRPSFPNHRIRVEPECNNKCNHLHKGTRNLILSLSSDGLDGDREGAEKGVDESGRNDTRKLSRDLAISALSQPNSKNRSLSSKDRQIDRKQQSEPKQSGKQQQQQQQQKEQQQQQQKKKSTLLPPPLAPPGERPVRHPSGRRKAANKSYNQSNFQKPEQQQQQQQRSSGNSQKKRGYSSLLPPPLDPYTSKEISVGRNNRNDNDDPVASGMSSWEEFLDLKRAANESTSFLFPRSNPSDNQNSNKPSVSNAKEHTNSQQPNDGDRASRLPSISDLFPPDLTSSVSTTTKTGSPAGKKRPNSNTDTRRKSPRRSSSNVKQQQASLDGVLPVSDLFYRSSQSIETDDEELPFSAEQSDQISTENNKIKIRRNQAGSSRPVIPSSSLTRRFNKKGTNASPGGRRKLVRRGMEMLVGGVPINADPPQRSVELWYETSSDWAKTVSLSSRDFGPLLHASSVDSVTKLERGLYCEHFIHETMKWDICPQDFRDIVKDYYERKEQEQQQEETKSNVEESFDNVKITQGKKLSLEDLANKVEEGKEEKGAQFSLVSTKDRDEEEDEQEHEDKNVEKASNVKKGNSKGFGKNINKGTPPKNDRNRIEAELKFMIPKTAMEDIELGESGSESERGTYSILKQVMINGITAALPTELKGFRVNINKLTVKDREEGMVSLDAEFWFEHKSRLSIKDRDKFSRTLARYDSEDNRVTLLIAEAARKETMWPEHVRNRVASVFQQYKCGLVAGLVFSIGVSIKDFQSVENEREEYSILKKVLVRGITAAVDKELDGFGVTVAKLVLQELDDGLTSIEGEFFFEAVSPIGDTAMQKKEHLIKSALAKAMDDGEMQIVMAASARNETGWPEELRNRVAEEFLFEDDEEEDEEKQEEEKKVESKATESKTKSAVSAEDSIFKDLLAESPVAKMMGSEFTSSSSKTDGPFGMPGSTLYAKDDIYMGGGNDGVFYDYSMANLENAPYHGELGPLLLDAAIERAKQRYPRVIAIGDVHGCIDELQDLLRQCDYQPGDLVVFLGDLVSKGPDSISVVQMAREIGAIGVRGNHDFEVIRWHQAIKSGVDPPVVGSEHFHVASCLGKADMKWLYSLPWFISSKELGALFVHAGFVSGIRLAKQNPRLMMNMRSILPDGTVTSKFFNNWPWARLWDGPQTVLFGHDADRGLQQYEHAIGLDTGCVYGGRLTACILPEKRLVSVSARREYFKYRRKHYD